MNLNLFPPQMMYQIVMQILLIVHTLVSSMYVRNHLTTPMHLIQTRHARQGRESDVRSQTNQYRWWKPPLTS